MCFLKKLHMYAGFFFLKFCFFKRIIKEEIETEICKNGKVDIYKCKYFSYFLISSKMLLQHLLFKCNAFKKFEIKKMVFSNYLFFLQMYSKKTRDLIQVNPFYIFYKRDISNDFYTKFDYETIKNIQNYNNLRSKPLELKYTPSFQDINKVFNDKKCFEILITKIEPDYDITNYEGNNDILKNIFYEKLKILLLTDFH